MLKLSEIFLSIQGESTYAGLPCIFIRLAECNLQCKYCDTTYSYKTKFEKSIEQVLQEIKKYDPVKLVEITGGEPLLQPDIYNLITGLRYHNYKILLETNGTIDLEKVPDHVTKIVDVKCPGSGYKDSFIEKNLHFINPQKDEIKFVLSDKKDYIWAKDFIVQYDIESYKILFSPVVEKLKPALLAKWITEDKLPVRIQLQLHKLIWGKDKRGV